VSATLPAESANICGVQNAPAFVSNDCAPAVLQHDCIYDVPSTGAASTVTLPAGADDGTRVFFAADGTKNAHTVQYRDATGPTDLTAALTASKRHLACCVKENGKWFVHSSVSP
jgi:streptogramin lyase